MENEIRYYLGLTRDAMKPKTADEFHDEAANATCAPEDRVPVRKVFEPSHIVTAVKLPTGAIEIAVNTQNIAEKIDYILEAYDDDMCLKSNTDVVMQNIMIV
jgi:hypothetical protein